MKLTLRLPRPTALLALLALPLAFGLGRWLPAGSATAPALQAEAPEPLALSYAAPEWRSTLDWARESSDAEALRGQALDLLDQAQGSATQGEAVALLGWVAEAGDERLLEELAFTGADEVRLQAVRALGRLGTDTSVDVLMRLLDRQDSRLEAEILVALGRSGHPRALRALEERVGQSDHPSAVAEALALYGTGEAAGILARAFREAGPTEAGDLAAALASFDHEIPEARQALYQAVQRGHGPTYSASLLALARAGDEGVFPVLLLATEEGSANQRARAAQALGELGDARAVEPLTDLALTGPIQARGAALVALGELDCPEATDALLTLVEEGSPEVAQGAIHALRHPEAPQTRAVLLWAVDEGSQAVRGAALGTLLWHPWGADEVPEAVLDLARREARRPGMSTQAAQALSLLLTHGHAEDLELLQELATEGSSNQRVAVVEALRRDGSPQGERLLLELVGDTDPSVQQAAIYAVMERGGLGWALEHRLIESLEAEGPVGWGSVEQALAELGTPTALEALHRRALEGTELESRHALNALAWTGGVAQQRVLEDLLDQADDPALRRRVYENALLASGADVEGVALAALEEEEPWVHSLAVEALARSGSAEARERLYALSEEGPLELRAQALSTLGMLGGEEAESRLVSALDEPELGQAALTGLTQLGTPAARESIARAARSSEDPALRATALDTLVWDPDASTEALVVEALEDEDPSVRQRAISALQGLGTTSAAETLAERLESDDLDEAEATQAALALRSMGGRAALRHASLIEEVLGPVEPDTGGGLDFEYFEGDIYW